jgi:tripartite-type tricarboxylate transporter receptor subunit TctC
VKALNDQAIKEGMKKLAAEPMILTPDELDRFVVAEIDSNAALVKAAGIQPN